jgi:hypothetical protein
MGLRIKIIIKIINRIVMETTEKPITIYEIQIKMYNRKCVVAYTDNTSAPCTINVIDSNKLSSGDHTIKLVVGCGQIFHIALGNANPTVLLVNKKCINEYNITQRQNQGYLLTSGVNDIAYIYDDNNILVHYLDNSLDMYDNLLYTKLKSINVYLSCFYGECILKHIYFFNYFLIYDTHMSYYNNDHNILIGHNIENNFFNTISDSSLFIIQQPNNNRADGEIHHTLNKHCVDINYNHTHIITGSYYGHIKYYDLTQQENAVIKLISITSLNKQITKVKFSSKTNNNLVIVLSPSDIYLFDVLNSCYISKWVGITLTKCSCIIEINPLFEKLTMLCYSDLNITYIYTGNDFNTTLFYKMPISFVNKTKTLLYTFSVLNITSHRFADKPFICEDIIKNDILPFIIRE